MMTSEFSMHEEPAKSNVPGAASTQTPALKVHEALERYSMMGETETCDELLHELRDAVQEDPGFPAALRRLGRGIYLALKGSKPEALKERHEALLQEMQKLVEAHPEEARLRQFLASALLERMTGYYDEHYLYESRRIFTSHDEALISLGELMRRFPDEMILRKRFCQAVTRAVRFAANVKQYDRCLLLLRHFSEEELIAQYPGVLRYKAECLANIISGCWSGLVMEELRALVEELRAIALSKIRKSGKTRDICSEALAEVLTRRHAGRLTEEEDAEFSDSLLKTLRRIDAQGEDHRPRDRRRELLDTLTGRDVVHLAGLEKQLGLDGDSGRIFLCGWWEPNVNSERCPTLEIGLDVGVLWAGQYLRDKSEYSRTVRTIFGSVIMTAIHKAFEDGAGEPKAIAFLHTFLRSHSSDWDWNLLMHLGFEHDLTDYFTQNKSDKRFARQSLSGGLGLVFPTLDWSRVNADPGRLPQFLAYYRARQTGLSPAAAEQIVAVTVETINRGVREKCLIGVPEAEEFLASVSWEWRPGLEPEVREFQSDWGSSAAGAEISEQLDLHFPALDWASVNASLESLGKFVSLYAQGRKSLKLAPWYRRLGELILQSLSLIDSSAKATPEVKQLAAAFLEAQGGELASRLATWLREAPKPAVEVVVRELVAIATRDDRESFSVRYGCKQNGEDAPYVLEWSLNSLFDFPLMTGNQDWGYCYRDGKRLKLFLAFFLSLKPASARDHLSYAHVLMHDLAVYSLERALDMNLMDEEAVQLTAAFARSDTRRVLNRRPFGVKPKVDRYLKSLSEENIE